MIAWILIFHGYFCIKDWNNWLSVSILIFEWYIQIIFDVIKTKDYQQLWSLPNLSCNFHFTCLSKCMHIIEHFYYIFVIDILFFRVHWFFFNDPNHLPFYCTKIFLFFFLCREDLYQQLWSLLMPFLAFWFHTTFPMYICTKHHRKSEKRSIRILII